MEMALTQKNLSSPLKGRDLLTLHDFSKDEIKLILQTAKIIKLKQKFGEVYQPLKGKTLGMIFHKASTRTRVSFEVGMYQLGGTAMFFGANDLQLKRGEPISDTAKVLSRYLDGIMIRTFKHEDVEELALHADIPIINGLTDLLHPCQVLADLMTIEEKKGELQGLKIAFVGDGNNMAHSLMLGCGKMGMEVAVATPQGYEPKAEIVQWAKEDAALSGGKIILTHDPVEAVNDADVIYTDVWASMGQEEEQKIREAAFAGYQVNAELAQHAKDNYIFLHCLPAHRGEEVSGDVIDGPHSVIFDEAENRLHAQKAVLSLLL